MNDEKVNGENVNGNESLKEYPEKLASGFYRVKLGEEQLGQFRILSKAKALCDENVGSHVFAPDGTAVYPDEPEDAPVEDAAETEIITEAEEITEAAEGTPIAYAILRTLMNIRKGPSVESEGITIYKRGRILEVLEQCENGWLKFVCPESPTGTAYVSNEGGAYAFLGHSIYTVQPGDNLFRIAEKAMRSGTKSVQIRETNLLTSNQIRVGMELLIP